MLFLLCVFFYSTRIERTQRQKSTKTQGSLDVVQAGCYAEWMMKDMDAAEFQREREPYGSTGTNENTLTHKGEGAKEVSGCDAQ